MKATHNCVSSSALQSADHVMTVWIGVHTVRGHVLDLEPLNVPVSRVVCACVCLCGWGIWGLCETDLTVLSSMWVCEWSGFGESREAESN